MRIKQNICRKAPGETGWVSCKIVPESGKKTVILQDSGRKMVILQDLLEKWLSCKICKKRGLIVKTVKTV